MNKTSLLARADRRAGELGMSRSSFFGYAVSSALAVLPAFGHLAPMPRSTRLTQTQTVRRKRKA